MAKNWAEQYNEKMHPITKRVAEKTRKHAAKFIFVKDKDGNAVCQRCEREFVMTGTKHLQKCKCPKCKQEMQVQHTWRARKDLLAINWLAIPTVVDEHTMVIRYISGSSYGVEPITVTENARMYISEDHAEPEYYCNYQGKWHKGKDPYFIPWYMGYRDNKWFCMYADWANAREAKEVISKMDCFKYYPLNEHYDDTRIPSQLHYLVKFARLNEKLDKVGLHSLVEENFDCYLRGYSTTIRFNKYRTDLVGMLRLTQAKYKALCKSPNMTTLAELQRIKDFDYDKYTQLIQYLPNAYDRKTLMETAAAYNVDVLKLAKYISNHNITAWTYERYLNRINNLGYPVTDEYYMFPSGFAKAEEKTLTEQERINEEQRRARMHKEIEAKSDQSKIIATISNIIRTAPELQEMFADAEHGLKIYVPESVADLYMSGLVMHNCLSTYVEPMCNKESLIFFIRKVEELDKDYVAFEYKDGIVWQIHESYNSNVKDDNVIRFADAFVEKLNEINIMQRLA